MTTTDTVSEEKRSSQKPSRSPAERAIVWALIVIGIGLVAFELRARHGYNSALEFIQNRVDAYNAAGDGENVPELKLAEVKQNLSGGPTLGEIKESNLGMKTLTLKWSSLFKNYELTLVVNNDTEEALVFNVKPAVSDPQ